MSGSTFPNVTAFTTFLENVVQIDPLYLPTDSPIITYAFNMALTMVNPALACVPCIPGQWTFYALAVYNLGADYIIQFANDQPGRNYFQDLRKGYGLNEFTPGVVSSSSDEGTSVSLLNIEAMKNFTISDLQNLKTPYGRQYLALAQQYGSIWGIS